MLPSHNSAQLRNSNVSNTIYQMAGILFSNPKTWEKNMAADQEFGQQGPIAISPSIGTAPSSRSGKWARSKSAFAIAILTILSIVLGARLIAPKALVKEDPVNTLAFSNFRGFTDAGCNLNPTPNWLANQCNRCTALAADLRQISSIRGITDATTTVQFYSDANCHDHVGEIHGNPNPAPCVALNQPARYFKLIGTSGSCQQ